MVCVGSVISGCGVKHVVADLDRALRWPSAIKVRRTRGLGFQPRGLVKEVGKLVCYVDGPFISGGYIRTNDMTAAFCSNSCVRVYIYAQVHRVIRLND